MVNAEERQAEIKEEETLGKIREHLIDLRKFRSSVEILDLIREELNIEPEQVLDKALQKYTLHVLSASPNKESRREQLEEKISSILDVALFQCSCTRSMELENDKRESFYEHIMRVKGECDPDPKKDTEIKYIRNYPIIHLIEGGR